MNRVTKDGKTASKPPRRTIKPNPNIIRKTGQQVFKNTFAARREKNANRKENQLWLRTQTTWLLRVALFPCAVKTQPPKKLFPLVLVKTELDALGVVNAIVDSVPFVARQRR